MNNNILNYTKRLLAIMIVLLIGNSVLTSCDDDEENTQVVLNSFGPAGVKHGDIISFIGLNLDRVTAIVLPDGVEIPASSFASKSSRTIELVVPNEAVAGFVTVKSPDGDIVTKTPLDFEVPVEITSITAEAKPGTNISIKGNLVNWIEEVTFNDGVTTTEFVSKSTTEVVVKVPMEAQTGFLIFNTGGTEPLSFASDEALIVTLPVVTALEPTSIKHTENLTIDGTNLDLVTSVVFGGGTEVSEFVSKSETQIVVTVPATAEKGKLTLKQASPIDVVTDGELTIILPVGTSVTPTPTKPGEDEITIAGTDLDLIAKIILPGAGEIPSSSFTARSATAIKLAVPATATQGAIEYETIHGFGGPLGVILRLPSTGGFPVLDYYIYKDALQTGWSQWGGWGHVSQSYNNAENPATGEKSIKVVFNDQYGAIQIHNDGAANIFAGYNYLVFYVHVPNEDSKVIVQINNNADFYPPAFTKDKYHQIVVPLANLTGANSVTELRIKNDNADAATNNTTVFIDEIGLTIDEPLGLLPDLATVIYDDAVKSPFGMGGGWGGATTNGASDENQRGGSVSIKATYAGNWSGAAQFGAWGNSPLSTAGTQFVAFSIYGGSGSDGKSIQLNVKPAVDGAAKSVQVTVEAGKWNDFEIPLSSLGSPATIGEISFQDTNWAGTVFIDHVGLK